MGKYSRLGKNSLLVFIGNVGSKIIGLLMLPFYTRWLSVADYGVTDIISVYVAFLLSVVSCCIAESIFIFPKGQKFQVQKAYLSSGLAFLFTSLVLTFIIFEIIALFSNKYGIENSFTQNIWLIYYLLISQLYQQLFQQFTRSIDNMLVYSLSGVVLTAATAGFSFLLIPTYGVSGYVASLSLANITTTIYSLFFSKAYRFISLKEIKWKYCQEMLKYSVPLIPNSLMWWLVSALNRPIMETNVGMYAIGLFAVANRFPGIISMLMGVFSTSWQISVLEEYKKNDFYLFYNKVRRMTVIFLSVCFLILSLLSKLLLRLFVSSDYYDAWVYIPILAFAAVLSGISGISGTIFSAVRQSKYFFYSSVWGAASAIVMNFILIPRFGIFGAAYSIFISFAVMAVSRIAYSMKFVKLTHLWNDFITLLISGLFILVMNTFPSNSIVCYLSPIIILLAIIGVNFDIVRTAIQYVHKK